jgi:hypothetical protein
MALPPIAAVDEKEILDNHVESLRCHFRIHRLPFCKNFHFLNADDKTPRMSGVEMQLMNE